MTPPLPFANDAEAEAEYRATRHLFTRPRVRFHSGTERITAGRTSPRPVVDLGERQGRTLTGYGRGAPAHPRTTDGVASPSVA